MATPHPDWNEASDGYEDGGVGIFIEPAHIETSPGVSYQTSGGLDDEDANAYSVDIRTSLGTAAETWDPVVAFADPDDAWDFAAILTHYFDAEPTEMSAKNNLLHDDPDYPGEQKELPEVVEDLTAAEAFRRAIHPYHIPESVEDALDDA